MTSAISGSWTQYGKISFLYKKGQLFTVPFIYLENAQELALSFVCSVCEVAFVRTSLMPVARPAIP